MFIICLEIYCEYKYIHESKLELTIWHFGTLALLFITCIKHGSYFSHCDCKFPSLRKFKITGVVFQIINDTQARKSKYSTMNFFCFLKHSFCAVQIISVLL